VEDGSKSSFDHVVGDFIWSCLC